MCGGGCGRTKPTRRVDVEDLVRAGADCRAVFGDQDLVQDEPGILLVQRERVGVGRDAGGTDQSARGEDAAKHGAMARATTWVQGRSGHSKAFRRVNGIEEAEGRVLLPDMGNSSATD